MTLNMWIAVACVIFALAASFLPGTCQNCGDPSVGILCGQLSKELDRALINDEGNLFRIRRAFFRSPTASPVLLKVVYNVTYAEKFILVLLRKKYLHASVCIQINLPLDSIKPASHWDGHRLESTPCSIRQCFLWCRCKVHLHSLESFIWLSRTKGAQKQTPSSGMALTIYPLFTSTCISHPWPAYLPKRCSCLC
jgi:hypothetical protein